MPDADELLARAERLLEETQAENARLKAELASVLKAKGKSREKPRKAKPRTTRRHETPRRRVNPSGEVVWVARPRDRLGRYVTLGTCKLKRDAQALIDAYYDREYGPAGASDPKSARAYSRVWLKRHPRSVPTDAAYKERIKRALPIPVGGMELGDWPMEKLRPRECADVLDFLLREQGLAAEGARAMIKTLKAMWADAIRDDVATSNPWREIRVNARDPRVRKAPRESHVWSWAQMHALAAASREQALIRTLSDCGLRLGEARLLERKGIRLNGCQDVDCPAGAVPHLHVDGKTGARVAPVPPALAAILRDRPPRLDSMLAFPAPRGGAWDEGHFYREVWYPARKLVSGMEDARPHDFRHSWVTRMRAAGIDAADAAKAAGHSLETATRVYTHPLQASFEQMNEAVGE